jgi:hypothetical protein
MGRFRREILAFIEGIKSISGWAVLLCIVINFLFLLPAIYSLSFEGRDFQQDYIAAKRLIHKSNIFSPFSEEEILALGGDPKTRMGRNFHPPTTLLFTLPIIPFHFSVSVYLWSLASIAFFVSGVFLISKELDFPLLFLPTFFAFAWFPFWLHIRFGQFSTFIFFLLVLVWRTLRRRNFTGAGVLIAIATLVKIFPAFLLIWAVIHRKWKIIIFFFAVLIPILLAIFLWYPESLLGFYRVAQADIRLFRGYYGNFSLNGILGRLFIGSSQIRPLYFSSSLYSIFLTIMEIVLVLLLVLYLVKIKSIDKQISMVIITMLLLSPTTWAHYLTIAVLPVSILLYESIRQNSFRLKIALLIVFLCSCFPHWPFFNWFETKFSAPLPAWFSFTALDMYVLLFLLSLFLMDVFQGFPSSNRRETI